jgi:hypothetical protein
MTNPGKERRPQEPTPGPGGEQPRRRTPFGGLLSLFVGKQVVVQFEQDGGTVQGELVDVAPYEFLVRQAGKQVVCLKHAVKWVEIEEE